MLELVTSAAVSQKTRTLLAQKIYRFGRELARYSASFAKPDVGITLKARRGTYGFRVDANRALKQ